MSAVYRRRRGTKKAHGTGNGYTHGRQILERCVTFSWKTGRLVYLPMQNSRVGLRGRKGEGCMYGFSNQSKSDLEVVMSFITKTRASLSGSHQALFPRSPAPNSRRCAYTALCPGVSSACVPFPCIWWYPLQRHGPRVLAASLSFLSTRP